MLLPNINTILNMDIEDIIYPGFNRSLSELNAITKLKKKSCEILDFTEIEWVRDVLRQRINENNDVDIKFKTPTEKQIEEVSAIVGANIDMEDLKNYLRLLFLFLYGFVLEISLILHNQCLQQYLLICF